MKKSCVFSIVLGVCALVFVLAAQTPAQITSKTKPAIAASSAGYSAALKYLYGDGVPQNEAEARRRLHALASQGNREARFALLTLDLPANRSDLTISHTRAGKNLLEKSLNELDPVTLQQRANAGEALAELLLGFKYFYGGNGIPKDTDKAEILFQKSLVWFRSNAEHGDSAAQYDLGLMYAKGAGVPKDSNLALKWIQRSADQGNINATLEMAQAYEQGDQLLGVQKDHALALVLRQKVAEGGDAFAQVSLGNRYDYGLQGYPNDPAKAIYWYSKAAEQGDISGIANLANIYLTGKGVPQDDIQGASWISKAASLGDTNAEQEMGTLYIQGRGVTKDYSQAAFWYRKAADKNDASSEEQLGALYRDGHGLPQDYAQARTWFQKAADQGSARAKVLLANLDQFQALQAAAAQQTAQAQIQGNASTQEDYQQQLRDHAEKIADLRQRVEEADSEAEQAENQAQEAKASAEQAANSGGGVFGTLAIALNGGVQFKAEQNAQKKRAEADQLRAQLTELGEEVIQPPPLPNSIEEDAGRDRISEARDRGIANINAAAAQNAAIKAQQAASTANLPTSTSGEPDICQGHHPVFHGCRGAISDAQARDNYCYCP